MKFIQVFSILLILPFNLAADDTEVTVEPTTNEECVCAGITNPGGNGGPECTSETLQGGYWCYVEAGKCETTEPSGQMEGYEWGQEPCVPYFAEVCQCAGITNLEGNGGAECDTEYMGNNWCYVTPGDHLCPDAMPSGSMPGWEWSYWACGEPTMVEATTPPYNKDGAAESSENVNFLGYLSVGNLTRNDVMFNTLPEYYDPTCDFLCCAECDSDAFLYRMNDAWGWTYEDKHIILIGGTDRTVIVDVTDGEDLVYVGFIPQTTEAEVWRDMKIYDNWAFIVQEASDGFGIQTFNMMRVIDAMDAGEIPRMFLPDSNTTRDDQIHNVVINDKEPILYTVLSKNCKSMVRIPFEITDDGVVMAPPEEDYCIPENEVIQVHDAQCVMYDGPDENFVGSEICFMCLAGSGMLGIYDWDTRTLLANITYESPEYAHQGWLSEDGKWFFLGDELDEEKMMFDRRTIVFDVQDLMNPKVQNIYISENMNNIDHNMYVVGSLIYQANYAGGMTILAYDEEGTLTEVGHFDSSLAEHQDWYGTWSTYPYFSSGDIEYGKKVIMSGSEGLHVVEIAEELECYLTHPNTCGEPETSDCTDCVTQDQYDELYAMVEEQTRTIRSLQAEVDSLAGLEETVTEVDQAMTDMATCMAAYVMDDDEEPEMTDAPEPEETMPEMTEPEMTEMPTMMPTEMTTTPEPTEMPTMMPSKAPSMLFMAVPAMDGMVCPDEEGLRTFKNNNFDSAEECADRCARDENGCAYFSYRASNNDCIGCAVEPTESSRFTTEYVSYMMMGARRQLSEVEALRRENAALKEALRQLRRN